MKPPWKVGILGAGAIAQGYDAPGDPRVLTLAHAVQKSPRFALGGFYDLQPARAAAAEEKWQAPATPRAREAWFDAGWDVIMIATPTEAHEDDLAAALARHPKAILVEKPLTVDPQAAQRLLTLARDQATAIAVDFPRRRHTAVETVGRLLETNALGAVRRIRGVCSGGLQHNGVHMLDLLAGWIPSLLETSSFAGGEIEFSLQSAVQTGAYVWELQIETDDARIELAGIPEELRLYRSAPHPNYPRSLALQPVEVWPMEEEPLLVRVIEHLAGLMENPDAARAHAALEMRRDRFFAQALRHFSKS